MIKRFSKILALSIILFFISLTPSFAREMSLDELGKEIEKQNNGYYAYIIGDYVFTSEHILTTQDIMLAARSINVTNEEGKTSKEIYNEMTIYYISQEWQGDTPVWKSENLVGTTPLNTNKINIHYLDENYVFDQVNTDSLLEEAQKNIQENEFYGEKFENGVLTYNIYDKNKKNSEIKETGLVGTIRDILKNEKVKSLTVSYNDDNVTFDNSKMSDDGESEASKTLKELLEKVSGKTTYEEITQGDLVGKELKLSINLDDTKYRSQNDKKSEEYTIKFVYEPHSKITTEFSEDEIKAMKDGINFDYNIDKDNYKITGENGIYNVTGFVTKQDGVKFYGESGKEGTGYYFAYNLVLDDNVDKNKVTVKVSSDESTYKDISSDFRTDGKEWIVFEIQQGEQVSNGYRDIIVDPDGEGTEYGPTKIRIDFSKLELKENSKFTIGQVNKTDADEDDKDNWDGWDMPENYSLTLSSDENDPYTIKATGLIPIDKEAFQDHDDPFTGDDYGYYLAFTLKRNSASNIARIAAKSTVVKFLQGSGYEDEPETITGDDFGDNDEIFVLKYLNPNDNNTNKQKKFEVIVDYDKEGEDKYAPFTLTIDWSELDFQFESLFTETKVGTTDVEENDGYIAKEDKTQIEGWGYKFDNAKDVTIENGNKLTGTIKEQKSVNAGFSSQDGYYVVLKIYGPDESQAEGNHYLTSNSENMKKWTVQLRGENGEYKTPVTPSKEDYERGFITVLFKLNNTAQDKTLKYKIDLDGAGNYFLPYEESIDYSGLTFETENKITYKYKDNEGKDQTEEVVVYEGEAVKLKDLSEIETDYRKFDGWYKEGKKVSNVSEEDSFTTGADEDITLTAHWNLNVEKFMEDVIADLKNPDSTYSNDFSGQFELQQNKDNKNDITINVESPNVQLSKLAETSIPGTIAYILQKGEIQDVTLKVGEQTATFNKDSVAGVSAVGAQANEDSVLDETGKALKEKVIEDAKNAFNTELQKLEGTEATATMDQVEFEGKSFTLKIGNSTDDTIKLVGADGETLTNDTYTFNFNSKFAVVDSEDPLGPDTIEEALDKNNYDTIYIDGDLTENSTINIKADKDVTIEPVGNAEKETGLMTASEEPTQTIKANGEDIDYAVDVQEGKGTVTIKDLKITGGKRAELRIEDGATAIVDNIDVSGSIDPATSKEDEMNSSIIVKGNLTATNVKNENESYTCPTISVVTGYATPEDLLKPEDGYPDYAVEGNATVTAKNMTKNDKYCLVDRTSNSGIHKTKETYYGSFYYNDSKNSQIYYVGLMDAKKDSVSPYDYILVYYYDEKINLEDLGYKMGTEPESGNEVFQYFEIGSIGSGNKIDNTITSAQDKLASHNTTVLHAVYKVKPMAALNFEQVSGLSTNGNKVSGIISTKSKDGKYCIPVTLSSEHFVDNKSTIKVTNPNGEEETYTYSSSNENGIATVSAVNTMELQLEAIKSSNITGENGKVYEIAVDVDGEDDEYQEEIHTIDYNEVKTLEEKINNAANNTKSANSLTINKQNSINGYKESFEYKYDNDKGLTYCKSTNRDNVEQYTFSVKYAGVKDEDNTRDTSVVTEKVTGEHDTNKVYINDWLYLHPQHVGRPIQELSMLTDVMKESHVYNAIDGIVKVENKEHTYNVTLNSVKYNYWVQDNYLSNKDYTFSEFIKDSKLEVQVELDEEENYVKSIKTIEDNAINKFDVTFSNINDTTIEEPKEFLAEEDKKLTDEDIKKFYEDGRAWWDIEIHKNAYNQ